MVVLVCGGAGYIGSHAVWELVERGIETVVIDNLEKGHKQAIRPEAKFYCGDIADSNLMDKIFTQNKIETVIHFAAYSLVGESVKNPIAYYKNNVCKTLSLLESMNRNGVKKIVFSSTAAVYGEPETFPITEDVSLNPINPYGETKLAIEKMLKWFENAYGLKYIVLRYFNVAGSNKFIGEDHFPETHLIPLVLKSILLGNEFNVYGDDYETPDGTCIRDYIHVSDLVEAHIQAIMRLDEKNESGIYNLGYGHGFSVKEIIQVAEKVTGKKLLYKIAQRRAGDPPILIASPQKAFDELNFSPKFDNLSEIISSAWEWHSKNPNGFGE